MKITHISLNAPVTDGWTYQDNLLPKYHKVIGYEVSIITSKFIRDEKLNIVKDTRDIYYNDNNVKTIRIKSRFKTNLNSKFKLFRNLYRTIKKEKPDVLFIHGVQFLNIIDIVKYLKKHPEVIVYIDNHADFSNSASNWLSEKILHGLIWKKCAKLIEPFTEKFYGVLPVRVDFLKNVYKLPEEKVELLLMGAEDEKVLEAQEKGIRKSVREKYNINSNDFLIMTGGKIGHDKAQILVLMQAIQKSELKNVKLIVFGSVIEELRDSINLLADGVKVQYIGWIYSEDSYKLFSAADLVVFPTLHSVLWEQAAAQGIPLLVKYLPGVTHIDLGGNCHYLYKETIDEIEEKIENIVDNPLIYENMKKIAQKEGLKKFSYLNIARQSIEGKKDLESEGT